MLTKIKDLRQQSKQNFKKFNNNFKTWKFNFHSKNEKRFPTPSMDISTDHLLEEDNNRTIESVITTKKMLKFRLLWLCVVVLWYMMYTSLSYLYMVIAAFIISLALEWVVIFWQRLTKSRWLWILITYIIATIFVLSGFMILIPFFFNRWTELLQSFMSRLLRIESSITELWLPWYINQISRMPGFFKEEIIQRFQNSNTDDLLLVFRDNIWNILSTSSEYVKVIAWQALNIFWNIFSRIADSAIVLTLCVFFSISLYDIKYTLKYLLRHMSSSRARIDAAYSGIAVRLKSQLCLCLFIWLASYIGLRILDRIGFSIPQKGTLALLAWLFEIIPYLGPFLWATPAAVSALIFTWRRGVLAIVILYTIIQQSEEKFLVPVMMWKTLGVSPLLVFVCILLCGNIMWFFWVLLAVPMAVIASLAFRVPQIDKTFPENWEIQLPIKKAKCSKK